MKILFKLLSHVTTDDDHTDDVELRSRNSYKKKIT